MPCSNSNSYRYPEAAAAGTPLSGRTPTTAGRLSSGSGHTATTTTTTLPPQPWGVRCTAVLIQRASDKAPSIRAKAMQGLSAAMRDAPAPLIALAKGEVSATAVISAAACGGGGGGGGGDGGVNHGGRTPASGLRAAVLGRNAAAMFTKTPRGKGTPGGASFDDVGGSPNAGSPAGAGGAVASGVNLPAVLRRRCGDDKAAVRKSAVAALEAAVVALAGFQIGDVAAAGAAAAGAGAGPAAEDLAALAGACTDPLVSVRRQGMQSLSSLLAVFPTDARLAAAWLSSVLPMVGDVESSLQERCMDAFQEYVVDGLMATVSKRHGGATAEVAGARSQLLLTVGLYK